jgi:hypothetical protein
LDGSQWGDLLGLLVARFGVADYNRATMVGKAGTVAYMRAVRTAGVVRFDRAETVKSQQAALTHLDSVDAVTGDVQRLLDVAAQAAQAAQAARDAQSQALIESGKATEATE